MERGSASKQLRLVAANAEGAGRSRLRARGAFGANCSRDDYEGKRRYYGEGRAVQLVAFSECDSTYGTRPGPALPVGGEVAADSPHVQSSRDQPLPPPPVSCRCGIHVNVSPLGRVAPWIRSLPHTLTFRPLSRTGWMANGLGGI